MTPSQLARDKLTRQLSPEARAGRARSRYPSDPVLCGAAGADLRGISHSSPASALRLSSSPVCFIIILTVSN